MDTTESSKSKVRRAPRKKAAVRTNLALAQGDGFLDWDDWDVPAGIPLGLPHGDVLRGMEDAVLLAMLEYGSFATLDRLQELRFALSEHGGLRQFLREDFDVLSHHENLGFELAARVVAGLELSRRLQTEPDPRPKLRTPKEIHEFLAPEFSPLRKEVFHVLCFNCRNTLLRNVRIAEGTTDSCPVDPREVFSAALAVRASTLILVHNHPSGEPDPSTVDLALTEQLQRGAQLLGMTVADHIVIGDNRFYSFREHNLLPKPGRSLRQACQGPGEP